MDTDQPTATTAPDTSRRDPGRSNPSETPDTPQDIDTPALLHAPHTMGQTFADLLHRACLGHLGAIHWFRTDWQRGGALTGYSHWTDEDGRSHPVVVKLPVPPGERFWLAQLHRHDHVCPTLWAHGDTLGGYDLAWVIMERLPHGPLGPPWNGQEFDLLIEAAGRFYLATQPVPLRGAPRSPDWADTLARARRQLQKQNLPLRQRWSVALKQAQKKLPQWLKVWDDRPVDDWCHGDLHLGNAMTRVPPPDGPALLLDFALTRPGHWVEDAVYFEHLFWGRRQRLQGRRLCAQMAQERKRHGLVVDADWPRLAIIRRKLMALGAPTRLHLDGDAAHLAACLEILESSQDQG